MPISTDTVSYKSSPESSVPSKNIFPTSDLRKLDLQLKHGSFSEVHNWLKAARKWDPSLEEPIKSLIEDCSCGDADFPRPHSKVGTMVPLRKKQTEVSLDVLFLEGVPVLHVVDKCTTWSEATVLHRRSLVDQIAAFQRIQVLRHGPPSIVFGNNEYNKAPTVLHTTIEPTAQLKLPTGYLRLTFFDYDLPTRNLLSRRCLRKQSTGKIFA